MYKRLFITFLICFFAAIVIGTAVSLFLIRHYRIEPWEPKAIIILPLLILLTFAGLLFRFWRWHYFLRRSDIRLPTRLSMGIYLSGFSQVVIPLFVGEIALKAILVKRHSKIPLERTILIVVYERLLDLMALAVLTIPFLVLHQDYPLKWIYLPFGMAALMLLSPIRKGLWRILSNILKIAVRLLVPQESSSNNEYPLSITSTGVTAIALIFSLFSWLAVGSIIPVAASILGAKVPWLDGISIYAVSAFAGGGSASPGGVGITGSVIARLLIQQGIDPSTAGLIGFITRLSTFGIVFIIGIVFLAIYLWRYRRSSAHSKTAFKDYETEFTCDARDYYVEKKANHMDISLKKSCDQPVTERKMVLDIGCGPGWYLPLISDDSSSVIGIDYSLSQVILARKNVPGATLLAGDICDFPLKDNQFDVTYAINIFHHLHSTQSQQQAFREIHRILKPGGVLMLHEMNVTNPLFRFYLGYVLPLFNKVDQGTEIWIRPKDLVASPLFQLKHTEYFTFLPDFLPGWALRVLRRPELILERSLLRKLSAHFMAVLQRPI